LSDTTQYHAKQGNDAGSAPGSSLTGSPLGLRRPEPFVAGSGSTTKRRHGKKRHGEGSVPCSFCHRGRCKCLRGSNAARSRADSSCGPLFTQIRKFRSELSTQDVNLVQVESSILSSGGECVATALTTTMESQPAAMQGLAAEEFDEIVRRHQRQVYRVLFLLTRDAEAADTLTQETFLRAYQGRLSFRGECAPHTWLLRIATNLARDHVRSRRVSFWKRLIGLDDHETESPAQFP